MGTLQLIILLVVAYIIIKGTVGFVRGIILTRRAMKVLDQAKKSCTTQSYFGQPVVKDGKLLYFNMERRIPGDGPLSDTTIDDILGGRDE